MAGVCKWNLWNKNGSVEHAGEVVALTHALLVHPRPGGHGLREEMICEGCLTTLIEDGGWAIRLEEGKLVLSRPRE